MMGQKLQQQGMLTSFLFLQIHHQVSWFYRRLLTLADQAHQKRTSGASEGPAEEEYCYGTIYKVLKSISFYTRTKGS